MSSQIIRLHGGDMVVKSRPKQQFQCTGFNLPIATKVNTLVKFSAADTHSDRIMGFNRGATPNSGFSISRAPSEVEAIEAGENHENDEDEDEEEERGLRQDPQRMAWRTSKQTPVRQGVRSSNGDDRSELDDNMRAMQTRTPEAVRHPAIANPSSAQDNLTTSMPSAGAKIANYSPHLVARLIVDVEIEQHSSMFVDLFVTPLTLSIISCLCFSLLLDQLMMATAGEYLV